MRVLVTGGHGFVGSHLVARLRARGETVRCLYRRPGRPASLEGLDVEIARGDVRDPAAVERALEDVDEVFHLAGLTRSLSRRGMLRTNLGGTVCLLEAAARRGLGGRFLLCSSLAAVGPSPDGRPLDESAPCRPVTWYGESKRRAEQAALRFGDRLAVTVVRPPAVYGPGDRDFLAVFRAARRGLVPLLGDRPKRYSFVYVEDLVDGMLAAARHPLAGGRTYFVAHREVLDLAAFLRLVMDAVGREGRLVRVPDALVALVGRAFDLLAQVTGRAPLLSDQRARELRGRAYVCRSDALARDTGWRARVDAAEGARRTAAWYRERGLI